MISKVLLSHRDLAGVHFTGSTEVFNNMWKTIGASMSTYRSYPRIVGETGGKDFIVAHARPTWTRWRWRWCAAGSSSRDRSARRRAASTCRSRSGTRSAIARSA
jgi:NAD-dependent aldehyde dehydrogenases